MAAIASAVLSFASEAHLAVTAVHGPGGAGISGLLRLGDRVSLAQATREPPLNVDLKNIDYSTSAGFNIAAVIIVVILIALYAPWW